MPSRWKMWFGTLVAFQLVAQDPSSMLQALQSRGGGDLSALAGVGGSSPDAVPQSIATDGSGADEAQAAQALREENQRLDGEIRDAKARENAPLRFAADLFDVRQYGARATDGGISGDYVLGVGDRLRVNVFGSATFQMPLQVDGRGEVVIPKIGSVPVAGLSLDRARAAIQAKVGQIFSRTTVDLAVTKLREVRVVILGEVYKPGSYLVPSLSSVVNVLGLSGGPTAIGSFRDIRILRGGRVIHGVDLYPLRAEGLGNMNFSFQNGDTVFVPLLQNQVQLEGAFTRVVATAPGLAKNETSAPDSPEEARTKRLIRQVQARLGLPPEQWLDAGKWLDSDLSATPHQQAYGQPGMPGAYASGQSQLPSQMSSQVPGGNSMQGQSQAQGLGQAQMSAGAAGMAGASGAAGVTGTDYMAGLASGLSFGGAVNGVPGAAGAAAFGGNSALAGTPANPGNTLVAPIQPSLTPAERAGLEERLDLLKRHLLELKSKHRGDQRIDPEGDTVASEMTGQPAWLSRWLVEGKAPSMMFEMLPGETVGDALRFSGGFALNAFAGSVSVRRVTPSGALNVIDVPAAGVAHCVLQRGDVVTALPQRNFQEGAVTVGGWARVQGMFARRDGERVGDLLKGLSLVLPDTYLERAELVRTLPDGSKRFQRFNVAKAMAGDPEHNLVLENRDDIELYRIGDLRLPRTLSVVGPVSRPGTFEFIPGMRAGDLLFRSGVPLKSADRYVAELAHTQDGKPTQVIRLDLARLLSREDSSPVDLKDDRINPRLQPYDQISVYAKPDYREHSTITLTGQVARPGVYELDSTRTSLREVIQRAGGLTPEAMPKAGIFLRKLAGVEPDKVRANMLAGLDTPTDPTSNGVNQILARLNETKRNPAGTIMSSPLLHGLTTGSLNRVVVNLPGILAGDGSAEVELQDGDEVIIPRRTDVAYVVGETASPFAAFKVSDSTNVKTLVEMAGGYTRNADTSHVRLLKADGRIIDSWVARKVVEPGDAVLVPQRIRRDVSWQETLNALTPIALLLNAIRH